MLGRERWNMWLCRKSRRPVMEAAKIMYCCSTLFSFLREKHRNSGQRRSYPELAGKRMINEPEGRREGWSGEEGKKEGYWNQVEREGIWRWVRRAR